MIKQPQDDSIWSLILRVTDYYLARYILKEFYVAFPRISGMF
jgi:hypothetical protein